MKATIIYENGKNLGMTLGEERHARDRVHIHLQVLDIIERNPLPKGSCFTDEFKKYYNNDARMARFTFKEIEIPDWVDFGDYPRDEREAYEYVYKQQQNKLSCNVRTTN